MAPDDVKTEIRRKRIHYTGLIVPIAYWFLSKMVLLGFVGASFMGFIIIDYMRLRKKNSLVSSFFTDDNKVASIRLKPIAGIGGGTEIKRDVTIPALNPLLRKEERTSIGAHTFFALGCFISIALFSKNIAIAAIAALVVGDSAAAILGKKYGKKRIYGKKTEVGTLACLLSSFMICIMFVPIEVAACGAAAAALTELFSGKLFNDNATIPIISGGAMTVAEHVFGALPL